MGWLLNFAYALLLVVVSPLVLWRMVFRILDCRQLEGQHLLLIPVIERYFVLENLTIASYLPDGSIKFNEFRSVDEVRSLQVTKPSIGIDVAYEFTRWLSQLKIKR